MIRVRPVLVLPVLAVALLLPNGTAQAEEGHDPAPTPPALTHGDLVGSVVTRTAVTTQGGESVTQVTTDHYDIRGRLALETVVGTDASGAVVSRQTSTNEYDERGLLVHESTVSDGDGDGPGAPYTFAVDTTFDQAGYVVAKVRIIDYDSDGVPEEKWVGTFANDHKGRAVTTTIGDDTDGDGVDDATVTQVTVYDGKGNVLRDTATYGTAEGVRSTEVAVNTYGAHGQPLTSTWTTYGPDGALVMSGLMTETYDSRRNLTESVITYDYDADGVDDYRSANTWSYDVKGRAVLLKTDSSTERFDYDAQGRLVLDETVMDWDGDGRPEYVTRRVVSYDHQGQPLTDVTSYDYDADGSVDGSYRLGYVYDSRGRATTYVASSLDGAGMLLNRESRTYVYASRTDYTVTTQHDYDGDGSVDSTSVETRQVS